MFVGIIAFALFSHGIEISKIPVNIVMIIKMLLLFSKVFVPC